MHFRKFQQELVSEIGLGTWQLGSSDWGEMDEAESLEILETFAGEGGNFIDTADVYGSGVSEQMIGKFLKQSSRSMFVATKLGRRHEGKHGWPQNFTYEAMKRQVEDSLDHLGLSQLFLEQLHCIPTAEMESGRVFDHLRQLQQEGLIRYWGASVETVAEALLCLRQEGIASLQIIFNLFRQHVADEVFSLAAEKNVAIIVRVPLASGLLTGKFSEATVFKAGDHRNYNAHGQMFNVGETFSGVEFSRGVELSREIAKLLPDDRTPQWALRWILDHPEVTTVIPGATKKSQVKTNAAASALPGLDDRTFDALRKLYDEKIRPVIRGSY